MIMNTGNAGKSGQVMLSLVSRQIWPHVLSVVEFQPRELILLHSDEKGESQGPAERLKLFISQSNLIASDRIHLECIPHNDYRAFQTRLDAIAIQYSLNPGDCCVNFTGGNKLMATVALEWAERHWMDAFYLERGNELIAFTTNTGGGRNPTRKQLDISKTNGLDAAGLLACQLGEARVVSAKERLVLNERGLKTHLKQIQAEMKPDATLGRSKIDYRHYLDGYDKTAIQEAGFNLEYGCAVVLLKLGVPAVYRSIELKSSTMKGDRLEGELDLVFNWNAKLWVVDCKDKIASETKVDRIRQELVKHMAPSPNLEQLLKSIENDLREKDLKVLREDLVQVAETGGLLGQALCIRSSKLPPQAVEFAESRHLRIIYKNELEKDLSALLGMKPIGGVRAAQE